jgi:hypothetical protein
MKQTKSLFMLIGIVSALIFATIFSKAITFEQKVEAQTNTQKQWEIMVIRGTGLPESVQGGVNMRGDEGWELVTVVQSKEGNYVAYLKRRK